MGALNFPCDWKAGFIMDPMRKQRIGYLNGFTGDAKGIGALAADIEVWCPFTGTPQYDGVTIKEEKATVVGIIESLDYGGGVGDPYCFNVYISGANSTKLNSALQNTLDKTGISAIDFWVGNFDEEAKQWYDECHPAKKGEMKGMFNAEGKAVKCQVAAEGVKVQNNIDVKVYAWYFEIVPAANVLTDTSFAVGLSKKSVRHWGLKVASQA